MKRIGILTFHITENYGAVLQAYALMKTFNREGGNAEIINYSLKHKNLSLAKKIIHHIWELFRDLFGNLDRKKRTILFREKYLLLHNIPLIVDWSTDSQINNIEKFVVGSDQVWNFSITEDPVYRLEHVPPNKKKYSYAASIGSTVFTERQKTIFKESLSSFTLVSVREESSVPMLQEIGIDCKSVLDPTLLLNAGDWVRFLDLRKEENNNKYVFCYVLPGGKTNNYTICLAQKIAKERNLKLVIVGEREYKRLFSSIYRTTAGPKEFVELIYNADAIVTNSFHGTCFSITFEKDFYSIISTKSKRSNRIKDILSALCLENRCIEVNDDINGLKPIKYIDVQEKLSTMRSVSLAFVRKIIED